MERLEMEKKEIADQIKDVYAEAKAMGYDTKALRQCVRLRKQDKAEREEQEAILDVYLLALGEI
ncbi:MAG: GapR family DNA-binding domain-containing protein [Pseudomonadota bacterium]